MGEVWSLDPRTLQPIRTHHFHGPRANVDVCLLAHPDGTLHDAEHKVTLLRYTGPDA
jgi:hypothetical protein